MRGVGFGVGDPEPLLPGEGSAATMARARTSVTVMKGGVAGIWENWVVRVPATAMTLNDRRAGQENAYSVDDLAPRSFSSVADSSFPGSRVQEVWTLPAELF